MNFYRDLTKQEYDIFKNYRFNPQSESDKEKLLCVGQTIRNLTKLCHSQCFDKSLQFSEKCVSTCFNNYFNSVEYSVKKSNDNPQMN